MWQQTHNPRSGLLSLRVRKGGQDYFVPLPRKGLSKVDFQKREASDDWGRASLLAIQKPRRFSTICSLRRALAPSQPLQSREPKNIELKGTAWRSTAPDPLPEAPHCSPVPSFPARSALPAAGGRGGRVARKLAGAAAGPWTTTRSFMCR
mmetsp:Transcript_72957/g.170966  ORF Transcript_72957/g.170966 Transcript_72957/m.170966 type:complete len:150 (-) Transcript_72957:139-588(-)